MKMMYLRMLVMVNEQKKTPHYRKNVQQRPGRGGVPASCAVSEPRYHEHRMFVASLNSPGCIIPGEGSPPCIRDFRVSVPLEGNILNVPLKQAASDRRTVRPVEG